MLRREFQRIKGEGKRDYKVGMVVRIIECVIIHTPRIVLAHTDQPRVPGCVLGARLLHILSQPRGHSAGRTRGWRGELGPGSGEGTLPREPSAGGHSAQPVSPPCWLSMTVASEAPRGRRTWPSPQRWLPAEQRPALGSQEVAGDAASTRESFLSEP